MSGSLFQLGERIAGYPVPVLNERAVRAAAGILFMFAIVSFMNAWLMGNFQPPRVFVGAFLIDFTLRIFVNPKFAPSLILGQSVVRKQQPEWVGAPQKRFAWAIGFVLALLMLDLVVIQRVVGPVNLIVCAVCLALLFCEAAFVSAWAAGSTTRFTRIRPSFTLVARARPSPCADPQRRGSRAPF